MLRRSACSRSSPGRGPCAPPSPTVHPLHGPPHCHLQVALAPPEVQIDLQQQQEYEKQLQEAANMPLPDGDDDDIAE